MLKGTYCITAAIGIMSPQIKADAVNLIKQPADNTFIKMLNRPIQMIFYKENERNNLTNYCTGFTCSDYIFLGKITTKSGH